VKKLFRSFTGQNDEPKSGIDTRPRALTCHPRGNLTVYFFADSHLFVPLSNFRALEDRPNNTFSVTEISGIEKPWALLRLQWPEFAANSSPTFCS
jgi:hypothetical protein